MTEGNERIPPSDAPALAAQLLACNERQHTVAQLGHDALGSDDLQALMEQACATVAETLRIECVRVLELLPGGELLLMRAAAGWPADAVGSLTVPASLESQAGYTLARDEAVVVEDLGREPRFRERALLDAGIRAGLSVVVPGQDGPYGVLCAHSTRPRAFKDEDRRFMRGIAGVLSLVIQRQRSVDALRRSEALFRSVAESTPGIVSAFDAGGHVTYLNRRWYEYSGLARDATPGERLAVVHPDDVETVRRQLAPPTELDRPYEMEFRLRRADGEYRWHAARAIALRDEAGSFVGWLSSSIDIHEQKILQKRLRAHDERLRRAQHAGRIGTFDWNVETGRLAWDGVEEVHGMEPGSFPGHFDDYVKDIHPDDVDRVHRAIQEVDECGADLDVVYRIITPDGSVRWIEGKGAATRTPDGKATHVMGTCQDITERQQLIEELREANRAKDEFLGLVSHELRTPITMIYGNAEVLERRAANIDDAARAASLRDIRLSAIQLNRIITNMLVLARMDRGIEAEREPTLLRRVVAQLVQEHQRMHPDRPIELQAHAMQMPIIAAREYIEIVIRNLLSNAEKYSDPREAITVGLAVDGEEVVISVSDRGIGISEEEAANCFTPFYRARRAAEHTGGVGVGLAVCQRIIEAEGGRIWAAPREGGGATFAFALPAMPPGDAGELAPGG